MKDDVTEVIVALRRLLNAIQQADIPTYRTLVHDDLTCFEPETQGHRVDGVDFHIFLTEAQSIPKRHHLELVDPVVRVFGDCAYATYTLLVSRENADGLKIAAMNETRVFVREPSGWKMIHFHRSSPDDEGPRRSYTMASKADS